MGMTQELLALVTGLAHYLKILIRIALTGALKLEREQATTVPEALGAFLDKLHMLAIQGGAPGAKRMLRRANGEASSSAGASSSSSLPEVLNANANAGTQGVTYGFRSLAPENAGESPFAGGAAHGKVAAVNPPSDLCVKCGLTVEEDCVRLGTYQRWHSHCLQCATCGRAAAVQAPKEEKERKGSEGEERDRDKDKDKDKDKGEGSKEPNGSVNTASTKLSSARRPPANVKIFLYDPTTMQESAQFGSVPTMILCNEHAHAGCRSGFQTVSRLEQYAFLLNVALRRLYVLLKKRGVVPATPGKYCLMTIVSSSECLYVDFDHNLIAPGASAPREVARDPYSDDINRLKSVHLDRKLSATARVPKRSTVVESPTGKVAQAADAVHGSSSRSAQAQHARPQMAKGSPQSQPQSQSQSQQPMGHAHPSRPHVMPPGTLETIRPPFARQNTEVMIVDESAPTSPTGGNDESRLPGVDDGITLADIPQLVEAAQAREQHRSLPRKGSVPFLAELNPVELAIVKHSAVLALIRSPLKDQFDLEEILELVEMKKSSFWNKLFKQGNDKKGVKKKGKSTAETFLSAG